MDELKNSNESSTRELTKQHQEELGKLANTHSDALNELQNDHHDVVSKLYTQKYVDEPTNTHLHELNKPQNDHIDVVSKLHTQEHVDEIKDRLPDKQREYNKLAKQLHPAARREAEHVEEQGELWARMNKLHELLLIAHPSLPQLYVM
jgi:hypothetical protein